MRIDCRACRDEGCSECRATHGARMDALQMAGRRVVVSLPDDVIGWNGKQEWCGCIEAVNGDSLDIMDGDGDVEPVAIEYVWPAPDVAALYVDLARGPYGKMGLDCWDAKRDATRYAGPYPVVAHPPCGPWGRLRWLCSPETIAMEHLAVTAVEQVRRWGGVLEHPADSRLWSACGLPKPGELPDAHGGYSIAVEQWWWGHRAAKPTWLYIVGTHDLPPIPAPTGTRPPSGRAKGRGDAARSMTERLPKTQRHLTPPAFATWLVTVAERCAR